ncbi:hypothetical protein GCM10011575_47230 [Microlunatus endophyticus]|uniref:Uncharacterized protein n=1 Tax=Microlunatus endophyticus TaxID=1716077 RepID=A0A917SJ77_9ACTN|nr:hypothetical protein [Microlunatus endophyticus]GGL83447.1 hypothetical protein GCM10011575_47230 [Microlunatus endophyticus]
MALESDGIDEVLEAQIRAGVATVSQIARRIAELTERRNRARARQNEASADALDARIAALEKIRAATTQPEHADGRQQGTGRSTPNRVDHTMAEEDDRLARDELVRAQLTQAEVNQAEDAAAAARQEADEVATPEAAQVALAHAAAEEHHAAVRHPEAARLYDSARRRLEMHHALTEGGVEAEVADERIRADASQAQPATTIVDKHGSPTHHPRARTNRRTAISRTYERQQQGR